MIRPKKPITMEILVVFDLASLVQNLPGGTIENPISLGTDETAAPYVYMITKNSYVISNQAGVELNVGAKVGDTLRWSVNAPGSGTGYNPILWAFRTNNAVAISTPKMVEMETHPLMPADVSDPSGERVAVSLNEFVWQCTILEPQTTIQYSFYFMVVDINNNVVGVYTWDPFITVS